MSGDDLKTFSELKAGKGVLVEGSRGITSYCEVTLLNRTAGSHGTESYCENVSKI